jgi:hypothetical protein
MLPGGSQWLRFEKKIQRFGILAAVATLGCSSEIARADESGLSFRLPGLSGSLAATPATPGWSTAEIYYHQGDLMLIAPTYTFATPVFGGQFSATGRHLWQGRGKHFRHADGGRRTDRNHANGITTWLKPNDPSDGTYVGLIRHWLSHIDEDNERTANAQTRHLSAPTRNSNGRSVFCSLERIA